MASLSSLIRLPALTISSWFRRDNFWPQLEQAKDTFDDSVRQVEQEVSTAVSNLRNYDETVYNHRFDQPAGHPATLTTV